MDLMKITSFLLCLTILLVNCSSPTKEVKAEKSQEVETSEPELRHVVLFKFKDSTSTADIAKVETAFVALKEQILEIKALEWGLNNSPEALNKEFTHCFFLTFESEEDRDTYLPHPAHKAFGEVLSPHLDDVLVVDYWVK